MSLGKRPMSVEMKPYGGRMLCVMCWDGYHDQCRYGGCTCWHHETEKPKRRKKDENAQMVIDVEPITIKVNS